MSRRCIDSFHRSGYDVSYETASIIQQFENNSFLIFSIPFRSSSALVSEDVVTPMVGSQLSLPDALFRNTWHPPEDASKKKKKKGKKGKGKKGGKKSGKKKKK